ncbi:MAG: FHA domain-containing protein, partial [Anaerolineae bacterium]
EMTQSGATLGTPTYMSPEQCAGDELDGRADLYSLGVVLYELFTNRLPFTFKTLNEALAAHNRGDMPTPPSQHRGDIPAILDQILARALSKTPEGRYADGAEMAGALRSVLVALEGAPTQVMVREEADILERVSEPPPGYELHIETPGHPVSVVPLSQAIVTLGRNKDNDVVLSADGVSRHHARLQATSLGWEIVDLGGINGTFLNEKRLTANEPAAMEAGARLRVGPYQLLLNAPEMGSEPEAAINSESPTQFGQTTPGIDDAEPVIDPLALYLPGDKFTVTPGELQEVPVEVVNRGQRDDRVSVRVVGISADWLAEPPGFVSVPAGETAQLRLRLRPPRHGRTPAGRQRVRLELISQQNPNVKVAESITLVVNSFVAFDASLDAEEIRAPGVLTVNIQNSGNAAADFALVARDRQGALRFRGETGRIHLNAGQAARIELEVDARQQSWFGGGEIYPFEVEVVSRAGGRQTLSGQAVAKGILPMGALLGFLFVVTFACVLGGLFLAFGRDDNGPASPTPGVTVLDGTQTAVAATQAINEETATSSAATAAAEGDTDNDGLSNSQEGV